MWIVTQMVVVILIEWLLNVLLMLNRNMILHPSPHFMLLHVLISLLTRLRLKTFKTWLLHLGWFPRDYRAVVHEENWANCPFKRKLYLIFVVDVRVTTIEENHLPVRHMSLSIQESHNDISECGKTKCYVVWVFRLGGAPKIYEMKTTSATSHWK